MNRLFDIARDLTLALENKTQLNMRLNNQRKDLEARQLALVPPDGWPGKNADDRKISERKAYAADQVCQTIQSESNRLEEALALNEVALEALVNERRALEWKIRAHLVEAITGNVITTQNGNGHQHVEDTAFDDFADDLADARLGEKYGEDDFSPEPASVAGDEPAFVTHPNGLGRGVAEEEDIPF